MKPNDETILTAKTGGPAGGDMLRTIQVDKHVPAGLS